jgi:hypothetical protein
MAEGRLAQRITKEKTPGDRLSPGVGLQLVAPHIRASAWPHGQPAVVEIITVSD